MNAKTLIEIIENISNLPEVGSVAETVQKELQNTQLSLVERAIVDAYQLQQDGKIADAIEKWRSIANIAEGMDNKLAAHAWFSIGGLLSNNNPEEALRSYDKAVNFNPDNAVFYNDRELRNRF